MDPEDALPEDAEAAAQPTEGDDPWHEEGWFFDLPDGAWERQEAKNRALRENIRVNAQRAAAIRALESRRDPFISRDPLSALAQHEDGPGWGDEMDDTPVSQQPNEDWRADGAHGSELDGGHATDSGRQAQSEWQATEQEPDEEWGEPGGYAERRTGPRRAGGMSLQRGAAPDEHPGGRGPIPLRPREVHETAPGGAESPVDGDAPRPRSRWDEMFGGPADTSIVEAMRDWTAQAREEEHRQRDLSQLPPELLQPFDWEEGEAPAAVAADAEDAEQEAAVAADWLEGELAAPVAADWLEEERGAAVAAAHEPAWDAPAMEVERAPQPAGEHLAGAADSFDSPAPAQAARDSHRGAHAAPDRKPGVFGRLLGRGHAGEDGALDEWKLDAEALSKDPPLPVFGGPASVPPAAWGAANDQPPGEPGTFPAFAAREEPDAMVEEEIHATPGPRTGAWGAPPTNDDGSLKYDLPRRITGKGVWEDDWFESPQRPAAASAGGGGRAALSPAVARYEVTDAWEDHRVEAVPLPPDGPMDEAELPAVATAEAPTAKLEEKAQGEDADGGVERGDAEGEAWEASECVEETAASESSPIDGVLAEDTAARERADAARRPVADDPWALFMAARQAEGADAFVFASDQDTRLAS